MTFEEPGCEIGSPVGKAVSSRSIAANRVETYTGNSRSALAFEQVKVGRSCYHSFPYGNDVHELMMDASPHETPHACKGWEV